MTPSTGFCADHFLKENTVVAFADDLWRFDPQTGLYSKLLPSAARALIDRWLCSCLPLDAVTARRTAEVLEIVKNRSFVGDGRVSPPFWIDTKRRADIFPVSNGLLDLSALPVGGAAELRPFDPNLFAVAGSPCSFDPTAECPKWRAFIDWMTAGKQDEQQLLAEYCAWPLVSHLAGMRFEKLLWLVGPGRNGKSLFLRVIREVLGRDNCSAVSLDAFTAGESFRLQPALFKLANFAADAGVRRHSAVAALNAFVSADPFVINRKYREQLIVEPTTALFFASNDPPAFADTSDAIWRRLLVIRCDQKLSDEQADPGMFDKLIVERDGVLNWLLAVLPGLIARRRFDVPPSVVENVNALKSETCAARMFLTEQVEKGKADDFLEGDQVMLFFREWCDRNGYRVEPITTVKAEVLRLFGAKYERLRRGLPPRRMRLWMGLRWQSGDPVHRASQDAVIARLQDQVDDLRREIEKAGV